MEGKAIAKSVRISPIKARLVIDLIRGKKVDEAVTILENRNKKSSGMILKVLNSAVANAVNNFSLDKNKLYVKEARVDAELCLILIVILDIKTEELVTLS